MSSHSSHQSSHNSHDSKCEVNFKNEHRYMKTCDLIARSVYRTIYRGYDNDSGCEVAWCVYQLIENLSEQDKNNIRTVLDIVKTVRHDYILMSMDYDIISCS